MRDFLTPMTCGDGDGCGCGDTIVIQDSNPDCTDDCACHDTDSADGGCCQSTLCRQLWEMKLHDSRMA